MCERLKRQLFVISKTYKFRRFGGHQKLAGVLYRSKNLEVHYHLPCVSSYQSILCHKGNFANKSVFRRLTSLSTRLFGLQMAKPPRKLSFTLFLLLNAGTFKFYIFMRLLNSEIRRTRVTGVDDVQ